jgi:hypothetical protein
MNNPPAFPLHNHGAQTLGLHVTGMSLRDYMAAKAMQGLLSSGWCGEARELAPKSGAQELAKDAYIMADAMLEARDGKD